MGSALWPMMVMLLGIAAKGSRCWRAPTAGRQLIQKGIVAGGSGLISQLGQADKAHGAEPVVDGHSHAAFGGPDGAVEVFLVAAAAGEAAAVNVEDDRQSVPGAASAGAQMFRNRQSSL